MSQPFCMPLIAQFFPCSRKNKASNFFKYKMIAVVRTFTQRVASTSAANSSRFFSATGRMMAQNAPKINQAQSVKSSGAFRPMAPIFQEIGLRLSSFINYFINIFVFDQKNFFINEFEKIMKNLINNFFSLKIISYSLKSLKQASM